jgi:transcriptional regulator with XRE-family HTH domain
MKHRNTAARHSASTLRERIRQARELLGMSRAELARLVGVGASAAVQWEQPKGTSPSVANLIAIAYATDVSFEWLATGRGMARVRADGEVSAIHRDCMAHDLYEENILVLARNVPRPQREPLLNFLRAAYPSKKP